MAKLKKLNNFYLGRFEDCPIKNSRTRDFSLYLARARARARPALASALGLRPLFGEGGADDFLDPRILHFVEHILTSIWSVELLNRALFDVKKCQFSNSELMSSSCELMPKS